MKRFLVFGLLWPPMFFFGAVVTLERHGDFIQMAFWSLYLMFRYYLVLLIPALILAGIDASLENKGWRLQVVCLVAALLAAATVAAIFIYAPAYATAERSFYLVVAAIVSATICSLLSGTK